MHNGPYQAAHHRLRSNDRLMRYLHALKVRTGKPLSTIVEDICVDMLAPDLPKPGSTLPHYVTSAAGPRSQAQLDELLARLRAIKNQRRTAGEATNLSLLIEQACVDWVNANVVRIDRFGLAVLVDGFLADRERVRAIMVDQPDFVLPYPSAPPPPGCASWDDAPPAVLARALFAEQDEQAPVELGGTMPPSGSPFDDLPELVEPAPLRRA